MSRTRTAKPITRRHVVASMAALAATGGVGRAQPLRKPATMILNTAYSGPQAWLLLAQDKGYLTQTGLDISFTTGEGAFTAAPRMVAQGFDFGYGDVNSLIEVAAKGSGDAPVGVFMMFNASPSTVAVRADGPIRTPADLKDRTLSGHATDVALRTFGAFCEKTGLDQHSVAIKTFSGSMRAQVEAMLAGQFDGVFGYVSTITAAMASAGIDASKVLRFINFADHVPDLYGSCLMATRRMIREEPQAVAALVRAINLGLADVLKDKDAAIDAVVRRDPNVRHAVDKLRLQTTLDVEMSHAEGKVLGIGDIDEARMARSISLVARTNRLARVPVLSEIFDRSFLPPPSERIKTLAS
jgi:NitT/TauT family transport system substrate-binding protein